MNDFVQENKRFLVTWVAGALVFFICWLIVGAIFGDDIAQNQARTRRARSQASRALPAGVSLRGIERERQAQQEALNQLETALDRRTPEDFRLAGHPDPDLHYNEVGDRLRDELVEKCIQKNIYVDEDLGRPSKYPSTPSEFEWYLRGLDVVRQVLALVVRADDEVLEEGIVSVADIEIQPIPRRIGGGRANTRVYATDHAVDFRLVGHPRALAWVHEQLVRPEPGRALVVRSATWHSNDLPPGVRPRGAQDVDPRERGRVEARLTLAALEIESEGRVDQRGTIR